MSAKFTTITKRDTVSMETLRPGYYNDNYDALNATIIGAKHLDRTAESEGVILNESAKYLRKNIDLCVPVFNYITAGIGAKQLAKILKIDNTTWEDIVSFSVVYDKTTQELVFIDEADKQVTNYLFGPQIALHYIESFDFDKRIEQLLYGSIADVVTSKYDVHDVISITRGDGDFLLAADYYMSFDKDEFVGSLKRGLTYDAALKRIRGNLLGRPNGLFTLLYNMNGDVNRLKAMFNESLIIIPAEMRPSLGSSMYQQIHKLTNRYMNVVKYNEALRLAINTSSVKHVNSLYRDLDRAVSKVQYKLQDEKNVKPDDKSIMEHIKSKHGHIRLNCFGKRQDYSARAVVTVDPYLSVDTIRIPEDIAPKLFEYHIIKAYREAIKTRPNCDYNLNLLRLNQRQSRKEMLRILRNEQILKRVPVVLGRQPTLHKQSLQGFWVELTKSSAIEVSPLICPAFNMDFDGDQAHVECPISQAAIVDVRDLIMTTQNIFLAKDGSITTMPRMDIIYGLYICTRNSYKIGASIKVYSGPDAYDQVRNDVMFHRVRVYDTITIEGKNMTAGDAAVMGCFPVDMVVPRGDIETTQSKAMCEIDSDNIAQFMQLLCSTTAYGFKYKIGRGKSAGRNTVVGSINRVVETGFRVARLYPPNMTLLSEDIRIASDEARLAKFHEDIAAKEVFYNFGFDSYEQFNSDYSLLRNALEKDYESSVVDRLEANNGYRLLMKSGARGNKSNLRQTFGIKGRVQKNDTESFDSIIEHSYAGQLTPMEHFVDAYGGRQGQINKSLKTGDTGYAMRKMWHTTQGITITNDDCGTTKGLTLRRADLRVVTNAESDQEVKKEVSSIIKFSIEGRYALKDIQYHNPTGAKMTIKANCIISPIDAEYIANDQTVTELTIRSPLACMKPCCKLCYGVDWSTHMNPAIGLPAGIIAAQSIGEPGTQLVLKQFQKGGVVSDNNITNIFDKVDSYLSHTDIAKASANGKYSGYDPLAWDTGIVETRPTDDTKKKVITIQPTLPDVTAWDNGSTIIEKMDTGDIKVYISGAADATRYVKLPGHIEIKPIVTKGESLTVQDPASISLKKKRNSIVVPQNLVVKNFVNKGEGLSTSHGDYDVTELLNYAGIEYTQMYLAFKLSSLYSSSSAKIRMNHFEILVSAMTRYLIISTDRKDLKVGQYCTAVELHNGPINNTVYTPEFVSTKGAPDFSHSALDSIIMEDQAAGLVRVCAMHLEDNLQKPLNRMLLGLTIQDGSANPRFIEQRHIQE